MSLRKILSSYFKNLGRSLYYGIKALFFLLLSKEFWVKIPGVLFVEFFWEGLATTVLFVLMIPAMLSGDLPIWMAIFLSVLLGILSGYISNTYDDFNPFRGKFRK